MRHFVWVVLGIVLVVASAAQAFVECPGMVSEVRPVGFQQLTVTTASVGLTVPSGTDMAYISQEGGNLRYRDDGTAPDDTTGLVSSVGSLITVCRNSLDKVRFYRTGDTDAVLNIAYYGR